MMAHDVPATGHLEQEKTLAQVLAWFFRPGAHQDVKNYCTSCLECHLAAPAGIPKVPLVSLAMVGMLFERVAMDLVGHLAKSAAGYHYILFLMNYATCFSKAVRLRSATTRNITAKLMKIFALVGLPKEI